MVFHALGAQSAGGRNAGMGERPSILLLVDRQFGLKWKGAPPGVVVCLPVVLPVLFVVPRGSARRGRVSING